MTRLLILSFSDISVDARVLKQVRYFAGQHEVTTCSYGPSPDPRVQHVRLDDANGYRRWSRAELIARHFGKIYREQPAVQQGRCELAPLDRFDVVLANDIDTVGLALELDPVHGVHADIHEYAPRQNEELLIWRVFIAPYVRWMCRRFLPRAASMTTVGQGIADEYRRVYGVHAGVVTNAAPYAELSPHPVANPIRLAHSGASIRNRRLDRLVRAAIDTRTEVTLDLFLMGNDPDYIAELRELAAGSDRVRFPDPVPYGELIAKLNEYDVGIHVVAPTNFNNRWALPNKFFDYVQARLGLIIGPTSEMQSRLVAGGFGAVARDFGAPALTAVLDGLTPALVDGWKARSDASAHALSAEEQVVIWGAAIRELVERRSA